MTKELLKEIIYKEDKPKNWREGQFVFNTIDRLFGVAREVQFTDRIDCYYCDNKIDDFLNACCKRL